MFLAIDDHAVYWTEFGRGGGRLLKVAKGGGEPAVLARGGALAHVLARPEAVYYISTDRVLALPAARAEPIEMLWPDTWHYLESIDIDRHWVYAFYSAQPLLYVMRVARFTPKMEQGMPDPVFGARPFPPDTWLVGVTERHFVCVETVRPDGGTPPIRNLVLLAKEDRDAKPITVARNLGRPGRPYARGNRLYYADSDARTVVRVGETPGSAVVIAEGQNEPGEVIADDEFVYWTDAEGLMRAKVRGGAVERIVALRDSRWLAQDAQSLYWLTRAGPVRMPKDVRGSPVQ